MTNILFISEDYVKTNSSLNDNLFGKNLLPAMREAQDVYLQQLIGKCLYGKLIALIDNDEIGDEANVMYKDLLDNHIRPYLLYQTIVQVLPVINAKLVNFGASMSNDEHLVNLSQGDTVVLTGHYQNMADFYARRLQEHLITQMSQFKELDSCTCEAIKANLNNSATCGIYLGGERGRIITNRPQTHKR